MLLLLGGFTGDGRKTLAKKLAQFHGFHNYELKQFRFHTYGLNRARELVEHTLRIRSDEERFRIYKRAAGEFPALAKMYTNVVIERTFHRKKPREFLFAEAKKYFDPVIFIWVEAEEADVHTRLNRMYRHKLIQSVEEALLERETAKKEFEPFDTQPLMFTNHGKAAESADRLLALIQETAAGGHTARNAQS